ncbi:MAG TPA: PH domain-containing protein, partial [Acidimicrobiales bacterium]|nr:PH domain-containing protein [Acidimicrobiales bacterium]
MSFPRRLLSDGEEVVAELRHHWVSLGWPLVAMICALALVAGVAIVFSNVPLWLGDAQLALLLIVAAWLAVRWARRSATSIVLTDRRLLVRTGVFGRKGTAIRLDQITGVSYHQTMVQRMIGSGRVLVETAGDSAGATFYNVRRPAAVQNLVTEQTALQHEVNAGQRFGSSYAPQQAVYQQ